MGVQVPPGAPNNKYYMKIFEVVAKITKDVDPETGDSTVGANVTDFKNEYNRVVVMPMNQIRSRFEGDGKGDTKDVDARANINSIKKQIKRDISKIPPILVRRIPRENTYQVIDGHHRYFAFREMNVKRIPVIIMSAGQFTGDKYKK